MYDFNGKGDESMSYIDKDLLVKRLENEDKFSDLLNEVLNGEFDCKDYKQMAKSFIGRELNDFFCNGFFGSRNYDLNGAEITRVYEDDDEAIVIEVKKLDDKYDYGYFDDGWNDWKTVYEHLEGWVNGNNEE